MTTARNARAARAATISMSSPVSGAVVRRRRRRRRDWVRCVRPRAARRSRSGPSKRTSRTRRIAFERRSSVVRAVQVSPPSRTVPVGSSGAWTIPGVPGGTGAPIVPDDARIRRPRYTPPAARATRTRMATSSTSASGVRPGPPGGRSSGADGVGAASSGRSSTMAVRPSNPISLTGVARSSGRSSAVLALHVSPPRWTVPSGSSGAWTTPVVPSGTRVPTTPAGAGMRRVRIAASVMKPMRMAVVAVVVTMSGVATCTRGTRRVAARLGVQGGRAQREADDPADGEQPVAHDLRLEREQHEPEARPAAAPRR